MNNDQLSRDFSELINNGQALAQRFNIPYLLDEYEMLALATCLLDKAGLGVMQQRDIHRQHTSKLGLK